MPTDTIPDVPIPPGFSADDWQHDALRNEGCSANSAVPRLPRGFRLEGHEVYPLKVQFRAANPNQRRGYINGHRR
jgi:hypothetical protein